MPTIEIFTSEDCGQCDAAIARARAVAEGTDDATVTVHDVTEDRSAALEYGVFSVPTTVVDGETTLTGVPSKADITAAISE